jgi:hypothetical protein
MIIYRAPRRHSSKPLKPIRFKNKAHRERVKKTLDTYREESKERSKKE